MSQPCSYSAGSTAVPCPLPLVGSGLSLCDRSRSPGVTNPCLTPVESTDSVPINVLYAERGWAAFVFGNVRCKLSLQGDRERIRGTCCVIKPEHQSLTVCVPDILGLHTPQCSFVPMLKAEHPCLRNGLILEAFMFLQGFLQLDWPQPISLSYLSRFPVPFLPGSGQATASVTPHKGFTSLLQQAP